MAGQTSVQRFVLGDVPRRKRMCVTIRKVVLAGVREKAQVPYRAQGYSCTPTVAANNRTTRFTCTYGGGAVRLRFTVTYA